MNRRSFLLRSTFGLAGATAASRLFAQAQPAPMDKVKLTPAEWRKKLTKDQYYILREEGTEPAGSSPLNKEKRKGTYVCAGCDLPLFKSDTKFESGTGWPSFYAAIPGSVGTKVDYKIDRAAHRVPLPRCGGHQGHVFHGRPAADRPALLQQRRG